MEIDELLSFAADTGRCLLESGGETSRAEDTLLRIIHHFYSGYSEILVVMTGFFINIGAYTMTVRVGKRTVNLDRVAKINMMSRDIVDGRINFDEARERLEIIKAQKPYPDAVKICAAALCSSFFTFLQGGEAADALNSLITGAVLNVFLIALKHRRAPDFIVTFSGGAFIALFTLLLYGAGIGKNINVMITGSIMPLVPGLAVTNALRDILAGDYLSGGARLFDAMTVAAALAAGAGTVMYIFGYVSGGLLV